MRIFGRYKRPLGKRILMWSAAAVISGAASYFARRLIKSSREPKGQQE